MILVDYNQISISNLMLELNNRDSDHIDFDLVTVHDTEHHSWVSKEMPRGVW